jgi:hypothetical protein
VEQDHGGLLRRLKAGRNGGDLPRRLASASATAKQLMEFLIIKVFDGVG